ncbi:hypothetical protein Pelo_6496 [Pelomyxa schiedti]|nr:hypothetical protein Pelo_6496 [Pelomyxa schiedti]
MQPTVDNLPESTTHHHEVQQQNGVELSAPTPTHEQNQPNGDYGRGLAPIVRYDNDAQESAAQVTAQVEDSVDKLRSEMVSMVDMRIVQLKAEIQANLVNYLNGLRSDKALELPRTQTFIFPRARLLSLLKISLNEMSIHPGAYVLDLPPHVLSQIVGYLPPKSVLAARSVCTQFRDAVSQAYGCRNLTFMFTAQATKDAEAGWRVIGSDIISTPSMNLKVVVCKSDKSERRLGVYLYLTQVTLYAQEKTVNIHLTADNKTRKRTRHLSLFDLSEMKKNKHTGKGSGFLFGGTTEMPSEVRISLTINDISSM